MGVIKKYDTPEQKAQTQSPPSAMAAAAASKKQPLQSSTGDNIAAAAASNGNGNGNGKKTIEEVYQKKTQLEHILLRPDTYIGSVEKHTQTLWVFENEEMVHRPVTYVPGLYKIFDEILVNAADNKQRDSSMDSLKVEINAEANRISIYNNGDGVPVEIHQEEGVYVPEMIFGHLLTSSNYDDNVKKTTGARNGKVLSFYSMPEYESWKESLAGNASGWSIKYYKGLGTSTSKEGKEYFQDLERNKKDFVWSDEQDGEAIELAFSKKKIEARKNWLRQFEPGTYLDQKEKLISYSDFVNKELILFSMADLQRSIPSMVDGLKPGQRKILFCSFKRNFVKEAKIAQFAGYVSEHSAYHHGEQSLASTITGMAQDFVGSNNINLLLPNGQFGTRHQGGKDHASARYIYTRLSPMTRFLFPKEDDLILDYLKEDGQSIEPTWYVPIIPMVLVNGSEGIGTGWSSYIPNYNPRDIVKNISHLLINEPMVPMDPWYRGFKGLIEKTIDKEAGCTYTITGIIEETDSTTLTITELPIRRWTQDYKEFLESLVTGNDKVKEPFIKDYREYNDDTTVHFEISLSEENMIIAKQEGLEKKFKLTTTISTSNMHLFDHMGVIKKYDTPEQILEEFFNLRITYYDKRKKALLENLELDLLKLDNKVRFILAVNNDEIIIKTKEEAELLLELQQKGFTPFPKKTKGIDAAVAGVTAEAEESEETTEVVLKGGVKAGDYDYLISMPISTLTLNEVLKLTAEKKKLEDEVEELRSFSLSSLWNRDLDALEKQLDELERQDAEAEVARKKIKEKAGNGGIAAAKHAQKKPIRKNNTKPSAATEPIAIDSEAVQEVAKPKPKPRGRQSKSTVNPVSVESDEDEELNALKNRLAAYNLESSPSAMETETVPEAAAAKKKAFTVDSDTDDSIFEKGKVTKGKKVGAGGKKPTNATKAKATTARKKREAQIIKPLLNQKLISEILPPVVNSPEKKVRKIRPSPFNKKSGSFLNKSGMIIDSSGSEEDTTLSGASGEAQLEDFVAVARPKRENRSRAVYVESGSEDEEEEDDGGLSDYSNFEEEDDD